MPRKASPTTADSPRLAVIGGSGFYEMPGLEDVHEVQPGTPFGPTSDAICIGRLEGVPVAFLARHGRGHTLLPSELPQRANIWALKSLGVERVLAISAVGSLREEFRPGDFVVPDQLIDRTAGSRPSTFFGEGVIAHVSFADPFCPVLRALALASLGPAGVAGHEGGSYVTIEGPAFGTRAESHLYRSWSAAVVGMTAIPEAKLAREAELCYAIVAAVTDYDSWNVGNEEVDARAVFRMVQQNVEKGRNIVRELVRRLPATGEGCDCGHALDAALVTRPAAIDATARTRLAPILNRRLEEAP